MVTKVYQMKRVFDVLQTGRNIGASAIAMATVVYADRISRREVRFPLLKKKEDPM